MAFLCFKTTELLLQLSLERVSITSVQFNLQWGCRWWDSNSQPLDYKPSALAIELYISKVIDGKELSLSSWCIA